MELNSKDVGAFLLPKVAIQNWTATAGGAGDATEKVGEIIDLQGLAGHPESVLVVIAGTATLADTKTLTLKTCAVFHGAAANMSDEAALLTQLDSTGVVIKTASGAFTGPVGYAFKVDVSSAKRYIRVKVTPDLSNTATDTCNLGGVYVFGGTDKVPTTLGII